MSNIWTEPFDKWVAFNKGDPSVKEGRVQVQYRHQTRVDAEKSRTFNHGDVCWHGGEEVRPVAYRKVKKEPTNFSGWACLYTKQTQYSLGTIFDSIEEAERENKMDAGVKIAIVKVSTEVVHHA